MWLFLENAFYKQFLQMCVCLLLELLPTPKIVSNRRYCWCRARYWRYFQFDLVVFPEQSSQKLYWGNGGHGFPRIFRQEDLFGNICSQNEVNCIGDIITIHMPQRTSKILLVRLTAKRNAFLFLIRVTSFARYSVWYGVTRSDQTTVNDYFTLSQTLTTFPVFTEWYF